MPDKQVKSVAIRVGQDLFDKIQNVIDDSHITYNKQEFTLYAIRRMYEHIFYQFNITTDNNDCDYQGVAEVLSIMMIGKNEFDRAKGEQCQFIVRVPQDLYDMVEHMGKLLDLSIQDFVKGSIIFEMRRQDCFIKDHQKWTEFTDSLDKEKFYGDLCAIQQSALMKNH